MVSHYFLDLPLRVMFMSLILARAYRESFSLTELGYIFNSDTCSFSCLLLENMSQVSKHMVKTGGQVKLSLCLNLTLQLLLYYNDFI